MVVGKVGVLALPADRSVVLLAHDVGLTRMTGDVIDHVDDDPLQRHVLCTWPPPRHPPRRVERELFDRLICEQSDTAIEADQPVLRLALSRVPIGLGVLIEGRQRNQFLGCRKLAPKVGPK